MKCTVTAFQSNGLSSSAPLVVTAGHVGYGPSVVLHQGRSASAPPAAVGSGSFALSCAPQALRRPQSLQSPGQRLAQGGFQHRRPLPDGLGGWWSPNGQSDIYLLYVLASSIFK